MKLRLWLVVIFLFLLPIQSLAIDCTAERCTTCDLCGFCQDNGVPRPTPGNWESCRNCLYPDLAGAAATDNETLRVGPENLPVTPKPGVHYTMIGCINTGDAFTNQGAAAGLVNTLLDLVFKTVGGIAFLYFIYGAFLILTSRADPERLSQGKGVIYGALAGLVFSLMAIFIVNLIGGGILRIPGFSTIPTPSP
ncbi:pilin [Patescibacteria group bacterium]|nr:pilin [Patescibacteria group bacterium]